MKKLIVFFILFVNSFFAQFEQLYQNDAILNGGFGITWINGAPHYAFRFFPEIQFSKVGIGLNINFEFTSNGKLRTENFNEFSDYLSIIRYIRYGYKHESVYFRIGALDYATLGHGSIMYLYNNSPSYDAHKIGTEFDMNFDNCGFETVYGNLGQSGVIGLRGYIKPVHYTKFSDVPVLGNIELGTSIATDTDERSGIVDGTYSKENNIFIPEKDIGNITIFGFDIGLPLIRTSLIDFDIYFDHTKIIKFGSGSAAGVLIDFKGLNLITLKARLERRFNGNKYLPSYFNSLYEIERFQVDVSTGRVKSKAQLLETTQKSKGYFGELFADISGVFRILGSFQKLDDISNSGILHVWTAVNMNDFPYMFRAGYDKASIKEFKDLFKVNEHSYLYAEFGYKLQKYLLLSLIYSWNFTPIRNNLNEIIGYKPQKKVEPRLSFIYPLNFSE